MILRHPLLQAFSAIVETGTVHAAADQLGLTQTAVTQRLKALEQGLKLTLFLRSRKGMKLTEDGAALLQYCKAIEEHEGRFLSRIGSEGADISLTIAGPTSALATRVTEDCKGIYGKYPKLRLHLQALDKEDRIDLVRRGLADLAIVSPVAIPDEMESKVLKPDRYLLVGSAKWKGRKLHDILAEERIIDFEETDPTTRSYLKQFGLEGEIKRERLFVNQNESLIRYFSLGIGFGTLTESVAKPHLERGDLITLNRGQVMEDPLALIWYPRTQRPDYFSDLIKAIR